VGCKSQKKKKKKKKVIEKPSLLGYCAAWLGNFFPTVRKKAPFFSSGKRLITPLNSADEDCRFLGNVGKLLPNLMAQKPNERLPNHENSFAAHNIIRRCIISSG
jgi:hypothetical protein